MFAPDTKQGRAATAPAPSRAFRATRQWPAPIGPAARIGIVGDYLDLIENETEADAAALLMTILVYTGNSVGAGPHFIADGARHCGNLFSVVVADTSRGRKGTSEAQARRLLALADQGWTERIAGGLSSGEGLIFQVRDPRQVGIDKDGEPIMDAGRTDHRLMVRESEFGRVLQAIQRTGCTLSPVLRQAWDGDALRVMTKSDPNTATGAHVSLLGHVTGRELAAQLDDQSLFDGLANRVLWVCARRQRELPFGGDQPDLQPLALRLSRALDKARREVRCFGMSPAAMKAWPAIYSRLTEDKSGVLGAVLARSEAQVRRLALVYAIMDQGETVDVQHLMAGVEVMRYSADSAAFIFGTASGDKLLDRIAGELREAGGAWVSREQLRKPLGNHFTADEITARLETLREQGKAEQQKVETGGRSREEWRWIGA